MSASLPVLAGRFGLVVALAGSLWGLWAAWLDARHGGAWRASALRGAWAALAGTATAAFGLVWALFHHDFSLSYVVGVSARDQPPAYLFSAWWGALEGSLLLWLLMVLAFALAFQVGAKGLQRPLRSAALILPLATSAFFAFVMLQHANPLAGLPQGMPMPPDGQGMNPLLQDPGMAIHPPLLYLGFTGVGVPAAMGLAVLLTGLSGASWIGVTRRWSLVAWGFLTTGILMGSWWAYHELGWGGWWFWDPVENASLMPWLALTAFVHSGLAQKARGLYTRWNLALVMLAYAFTLFGTFLTRSGIITSVHAFSESSLGLWFLGYIAAFLAVAAGALAWRWEEIRDKGNLERPASREGALLFNNVLLLGLLFAVFFGTTWPIWAELLTGERVSVGAPYFDRTIPPLAMPTLILMAIAPWLGWRRAGSGWRALLPWGLGGGALAAAVLLPLGAGVGVRLAFTHALAVFLLGFVAAPAVVEFTRAARRSGGATLAWRRRPRRWGALIVHLGVLVLAVGATGATAGKMQVDIEVANGEAREIAGGLAVRHNGMEWALRGNHSAWVARAEVRVDGNWRPMSTERRDYGEAWPATTEMAIHSDWRRDVGLSLAEASTESATFRLISQPWLSWMWAGGALAIGGFLLAGRPD